jgi:hypothetical protein
MDWIPLNAPKPEDGKTYDIRMNDGQVVTNVEFWGFGGGFDPLGLGETSPYGVPKVKYPISEVKEYRPHKS